MALLADGGSPTTIAGLVADFYNATPPAGRAMWATIGGNIYVVESAGAGAASQTDTSIIEIVGGASLSATGTDHFIHIA